MVADHDERTLVCESCGRVAEVRLSDGSTWCLPCHASALNLGYDTDLGVLLTTGEAPSEQELVEVGYDV